MILLADNEPSIPKIVIPTTPSSPGHEDIVTSKRRETAATSLPQRSLSLTHVSYPSRPNPQRRSTINTKSHHQPSSPSSRPILQGYGASTDTLAPPTSIRLLGPEPYIDLTSSKESTTPKDRRPSAYSSYSSSSSSSSSSSCTSYKEGNNHHSRHQQHRKATPDAISYNTALSPSDMITNTR